MHRAAYATDKTHGTQIGNGNFGYWILWILSSRQHLFVSPLQTQEVDDQRSCRDVGKQK